MNRKFKVLHRILLISFGKLNKKVQIHISDAMPMKIQYGMDTFMDKDDDDEDEDKDKNYIRFFLAPKIDD